MTPGVLLSAAAMISTIPYATARPSKRSDGSGDEVVGEALEQEQLYEVAASRADRPRDAELAASLGGQHDEDQEDEQDAGSDRERAERREERHERRALLVGELECVALRRPRLESRAARASERGGE